MTGHCELISTMQRSIVLSWEVLHNFRKSLYLSHISDKKIGKHFPITMKVLS